MKNLLSRVSVGLMLFGSLATGAVVAAPVTFAGTSDPVSCNGLVQTYLKAPVGAAYVPFTAVSEAIDNVATYAEGSMFYSGPTSLTGSGTQYFNNKRYDALAFSSHPNGYPFDPNQAQPVSMTISYAAVADSSGRQLHLTLSGNGSTSSATPVGCFGTDVLYATIPGYLVGPAKLVAVRLGAITAAPIPN
jgi:hypothetical protein